MRHVDVLTCNVQLLLMECSDFVVHLLLHAFVKTCFVAFFFGFKISVDTSARLAAVCLNHTVMLLA